MRLNNTAIDKKPWFLFRNKQFFLFILCSFVFGVYCGWKNLPGKIKAHCYLLLSSELVSALWEENDLKIIHLDINFKNFQKIVRKRDDAMNAGKLETTSKDFVKATISQNNRSMECEIRLKGDLSDHWEGSKWSFRVNMKKENKLWGMSKFSLQDPVTRLNTNEWLFHETLKKEGLLSVRYDFVNLVINGKDMGIYAIEEHFSKEFIESNKRRQGVVVGFDDYLNWKRFPIGHGRNINSTTLYRSLPLKVRDSKRVENNPTLWQQAETAFNLIRKLQEGTIAGDEIFSPSKLGKFLAICHIWNAEHNFQINNINFFYDPISGQLEPIGFDAWANSMVESPYCYFTSGDTEYSWVNHALSSPQVAYHYINALSHFSSKRYEELLKADLKTSELKFRRLLTRDLWGQSSTWIWKNSTSLLSFDPWQTLGLRNDRIRDELSEKQPILGYGNLSEDNRTLEVVLRNTLKQPVEIHGFCVNGEEFSVLDHLVTPIGHKSNDKLWQSIFVLPVQGFEKQKITGEFRFRLKTKSDLTKNLKKPTYISARLLGLDSEPLKVELPINHILKRERIPVSKYGKKPLIDYDFISKTSPNNYLISPGNHQITSDFFVPANCSLFISPNTTLCFDEDSTMISLGSIIAEGNALQPITFTSTGSSWAGILVNESPTPSIFEHCIFENINGVGKASNPKGIERSGWNMTGAVNLYHADVSLRHCRFDNLLTEDALNIIHSNFELHDSNFTNLYSDGFDGDFVKGSVENCNFERINGDGVDFSGSDVFIRSCHFFDIDDKAVSAGEKSLLKIDSISVRSVGYGVVSKDQSEVSLSKSNIHNASISAIAAYQKKPEFGPAKIFVRDTTFKDSSRNFMIQSRSYAERDGNLVKTSDFSAQSLYQKK